MAVREILKYPHPLLKRKAKPVVMVDEGTRRIIADMIETMYAAPGIGLAAPQIGELLRIIVVDVSVKEKGNGLIVLINPEIVYAEGEIVYEEGCLSVPDFSIEVKRASDVVVKGLDREGLPVELKASGLEAVAIQHEIDHLNGTLIIDRVSFLKRELYRRNRKKLLQKQT